MSNVINIDDFIKSSYIKDCIHKNNVKIDYLDEITIILNSDASIFNKRDAIKKYVEDYNVQDRLGITHIEQLKKIINDIDFISKCIYCVNEYCVLYTDDVEKICSYDINDILKKIKYSSNNYNIDIFNLKTSNIVGNVTVNSDNKIIDYTINCDDTELDDIKNRFVYINNNLKIGDVIKVHGFNDKYVLVSNPSALKDFNNLTFEDTKLVAISIDLLNNNEDYSKQIESIYADRIHNIENPLAEPDIIMNNKIIISLFDVEVYSSN